MFRRLTIGLGIGVAVCALALTACSSGSDDEDDEDATQEPAATGQAPTAEADDTATPGDGEGDEGDGNGGDDGDLDDLRAAFEAFATATFTATYEVTGGGLEGTQSLTMYRDGADRLRFDISGTMNGETFEGSLFSSAEGSLFCSEGDQFAGLPGVDPNAEGVCLQTGAGGANPFANIEEFLGELDSDEVDVISTEEREIAGETGNCFTVAQAGEESTACVSDDGVLLFADGGTAGETFTMTATAVSNEVDDSEFTPPYPVVELPAGF